MAAFDKELQRWTAFAHATSAEDLLRMSVGSTVYDILRKLLSIETIRRIPAITTVWDSDTNRVVLVVGEAWFVSSLNPAVLTITSRHELDAVKLPHLPQFSHN